MLCLLHYHLSINYSPTVTMKTLLLFLLCSFCLEERIIAQATIQKDTTAPQPPPHIARNMFGHRIPRGLILHTNDAADGYVLFSVPNSGSMYLVNRKGEVVHEWKGSYNVLGGYLQDDGSVIMNSEDPDFQVFAGGGQSGRIQQISWDGKMQWDYEYATDDYLHHHDFTVMPNGHILAIAWEAKTADEARVAGRKPNMIPKAGLWPDKIIEIAPEGRRGGQVVWEWHLWDHLVQDFDASKNNWGNPANHPELLDFNVGDTVPPPITEDSLSILKKMGRARRNETPENRGSDVYHINAIKYNADLDQIAISSPHLHEIFIIDHSTSTAEAAGHTGGRWHKGGDFLYRWGNPQNYRHGDSSTQLLYGQHDVRWIETGKLGAGHLTVFNNDIPGKNKMNYSAVWELAPPTDKNGNYTMQDGHYGPEKPAWTYTASDTVSFWSSFISGAHRTPNGNTFICEGARGRFFEVTPEGKIVWEYLNPYRGQIRHTNGDSIPAMPMTYFGFRATFIPADHPALANRKMQPITPQPVRFTLPPAEAKK